MSDKARDLLEDALIWFEATGNCFDLSDEIRAYLAEPEKKQEPLSEKYIRRLFTGAQWSYEDECAFIDGIRFAEKHYGIGGEDEQVADQSRF